ESTAVIGLGLIGQITLDLLRANGVNAIGFDIEASKVELARKRGFLAYELSSDPSSEEWILQHAQVHEYDGVIVTASSNSDHPMKCAAALCRRRPFCSLEP